MCSCPTLYVLLIARVAFATDGNDESGADDLFEDMKSELATRGPCWVEAIEELDPEDRSKERLAFNFMNCFFKGAKFPPYFCAKDRPLPECDDFRKLLLGVHRNVYLVFHHQAELLVEYLKERDRQKNIGQQIMLRESALTELRAKLAKSSDFLLESLDSDEEIFGLKQIVTKSHGDYKQSLRRTQRILYEIKSTVTQYKFLGFTIAGLALFAVNQALRVVV
ncbi:uncharacterized protein LOC114828597 [Galendromus occidentalis]|uniref:Uncharacterized protein LOC114828597 n=1 Tax=Galendromus occidentalis TaxID=34638 RepID=A0AAJ7SI42_9ACAR|nr:uncharacterized protein LOC114828597 [Galendromus occidentalis]